MTKIALKFKRISRCSAENSVIKLLSSERANISIKSVSKGRNLVYGTLS